MQERPFLSMISESCLYQNICICFVRSEWIVSYIMFLLFPFRTSNFNCKTPPSTLPFPLDLLSCCFQKKCSKKNVLYKNLPKLVFANSLSYRALELVIFWHMLTQKSLFHYFFSVYFTENSQESKGQVLPYSVLEDSHYLCSSLYIMKLSRYPWG